VDPWRPESKLEGSESQKEEESLIDDESSGREGKSGGQFRDVSSQGSDELGMLFIKVRKYA